MRKFIVFLLLPLLFCSSCRNGGFHRIVNASEAKPEKISYSYDKITAERIDTFFRHRHQKGVFNGVVLFADKGSIVYENAFGFSNFKTKEPLSINSVFQLASVSKQFTAAAIMLLKQEGKISYADSIKKFFPAFPYSNITIRELLNHSSGLPNYMYFTEDYWQDKSKPITNKDVVDLMIRFRPKEYFQPGKLFNYSNTGYCLLAAIVEKVSGMSFPDFMKNNFFIPLGMNHTFITNGQPNTIAAKGYYRPGKEVEFFFQDGIVGDKGVFSTVEDLLRWDMELYNGHILNKNIIDEAFLPGYQFKTRRNYGFGWRIINYNGLKVVYHGGWWKGYRAYFIRSIEDQKTVIVLMNVATHVPFRVNNLLDLFSDSQSIAGIN